MAALEPLVEEGERRRIAVEQLSGTLDALETKVSELYDELETQTEMRENDEEIIGDMRAKRLVDSKERLHEKVVRN